MYIIVAQILYPNERKIIVFPLIHFGKQNSSKGNLNDIWKIFLKTLDYIY